MVFVEENSNNLLPSFARSDVDVECQLPSIALPDIFPDGAWVSSFNSLVKVPSKT